MSPSDLAKLRGRLRLLRDECQKLGQAPPKPPTLRAAVGALFVSAARRAMFWHIPPLRNALTDVTDALDETLRLLEADAADAQKLAALEKSLDPLYLAFENELRGSRDEIMDRLRVYLPFLPPQATVLDLGCGRGEWLEVLRQAGFNARGVDSNSSMVVLCRQLGLDARESGLLEHLVEIPADSVDVVTAFHVVEHLPFVRLIQMLDETVRVLRPGGLAIFETPNPDNFLVGSRNFYYDFTHRNPLPVATLRFLVEQRGLKQIRILPLHPCDPCNHVRDDSGEANTVSRRFNDYFYGPQDYAILAGKP